MFRERIECGAAAAAASHVEGQDGHGHVELVDGVDDDGGGGEEGEHEQEQEVDQHVAAEPAEALHRQVLPGGRGEGDVATKTQHAAKVRNGETKVRNVSAMLTVMQQNLKFQCVKFGPIYDFYIGKSPIYCS